MSKIFKALAIIVLLATVGCSNSLDKSERGYNQPKTKNFSFTGTINEIKDDRAIVSAKLFEGNPEGDVFVDLSVNSDETFSVGDKVKVEFDGNVDESNPAQIKTLSVELAD